VSAGQIALTAVILLVAYLIRSMTGFGSSLVAVPLLALFLPLQFVVPLTLLLDFTTSVVMSGIHFERVKWNEIGVLIPFGMLGAVLGAKLLANLPTAPMLMVLTGLVFIFGVRSVFHVHGDKPVTRAWAAPAALTGGTVGALFGAGGPPYVIYLTHRIQDKDDLRATFSVLFLADGMSRVVIFLIAGLLMNAQVWTAYFAALPLMLGALYLGGRLQVGLSESQMARLVGVLLVGSSISLLFKALHE